MSETRLLNRLTLRQPFTLTLPNLLTTSTKPNDYGIPFLLRNAARNY